MVTECYEAQADFTSSLMFNRHTKATDFGCTSYLYEQGGSFRPLALLKGRGVGSTVSYYVNDQIGTPQELLDEDGNMLWSAIYRAYGHAEMQAGVRQPLRFQGQYADEESGLHYNRYRYYNPLSGRYMAPDPAGLAGSINSYSYVIDPLQWVDPLGLKYQSGCRSSTVVSGKDKTNKSTQNLSENRRTINAEDIADERQKFLGDDYVKVGEGKWRSLDGQRQFRVKPDDYSFDGSGHGMGMPNVAGKSHVHLEFLRPTASGNFVVLKNIHIALNIGK